MAGWVCNKCTTLYTADAPQCPNCGHKVHHEQGEKPKKEK